MSNNNEELHDNLLYSKKENIEIEKLAKAIVSETDIKMAKILVTYILEIGEERKQREIKSVLGIKD